MASNNFINECKEYANSNRLGKITIGNNEINQDNYLSEFEVNDGCFVNGSIIGSVYVKAFNGNFLELPDTIEIENKQLNVQAGVKFDDDTTEYVNLGNYDITTIKNSQTDIPTSIEAFDRLMNKLDKKYVCNIDFSTSKTIKNVYIDVCNNLGLTPVTTTFLNSDIEVVGNPFTENDTNRAVLQAICKVSCSYVELDESTGKIDLKWLSTSAEPDYIFNDGDDFSTLEGGITTFGPVNVVTIANSEVPSENVSMGTGDNEVVINEDYFLYNATLRQKAITNIYNRLKGLTYVDLKLTTYTGKPFIKVGSKIRVIYEGKTYDTYALIHTFKYDGTFTSIIESPALTKQETQIKNDVSLKEIIKNTQLIVNKQEGKINGLVTKTEDLEKEVTTTKETNGNNSLYIEDALESRVLEYGIEGKSEQETRSGKNLLPIANTFGGSTTISGVTFTLNKDGTIKVNGTASAGISLYLFNDYIDLPSGTYTLSDSITSGVSGTTYFLFCDVKHKDGSAWDTKNMSTVSSEKTRTMGENFKAKVRIVIRSGQTLNNVVFKPQLEKNSVATEYEQYGVSPSPDYPSEIKSVEGIRNLFDLGTSLDDYFLTLIDGTKINTSLKVSDYVTATFTKNGISISNYNNSVYPWLSKIITLEKNTDYIISGIVSNGVKILGFPSLENGTIGTQISYIDNANLKPPKTFNSGNYAYYVISMYPPTNAYFEELQIEPGSIAHSYVPYGSWLKVQTTGKNIFDYANTNNWNTYGYYCNFELIDNGIRAIVNSESVLQYNYRTIRLDNINNLLGKTISISYEAKSSGANKPMVVLYWVKDFNLKTSIQNITTNNVVKIPNEIPSDANGLAILLYASGSGGTAVNGDYVDYTNIQIEYGTKTDYEPYKENITLIDMNKPNLFDKDNADILNLYPGTTFGSNTKYQSICIPIEPNTTYTLISLNHYSDGLTLGTSEEYPVVDGKTTNSLSVAKTKNNITITSGANDKYLLGYILWGTSISEEILNGIKIYKGVGIDDYYELCSINAKDNLKVSENGTTTIEKKIVEIALDGSETIKNVTGNNGAILHCISVPNCSRTSGTAIPNILSNKFIKQTRDNLYNGFADGICYGSVGSTYYYDIIIRSSELDSMSVDEFKTWLSENKPIIQYELAEPYTIDLGTIDISLFENINHINLLEDIETDTRVKYLINNVMNGTYATKGELELTNEQFQTTITNEFNSLERQMTSITQTGGAIDLAIQSSKNYTDSKNESLDNRITNSENNYNDLNNKYNTLYGKITDMNFSFKTDGLTIGTSGSEINSKLDNKGLKIYNASTLIAIFNQNGSGFKKLIATESIQLQNLLIQKRVINTPKANNMEVISFFFNKSLIENLTDLESD